MQVEQAKAASEIRRRRNLLQNAILAEDPEDVNTALNTAIISLTVARAGLGVSEMMLEHTQ